jgi:hydroxybutyrate-dimer hydrolase
VSKQSNPVGQIVGEPIRYELDGITDDLLTGGLGVDGLRSPPPGFADPLHPTPRELRRRAIHANYRSLTDLTPGGGFGTLYGPSTSLRIAGVEYLFGIRTPDGCGITVAMLQIPRNFDASNPCVLAVASSGSRNIYGALPTAAEWGLRNGCAVIHTDKGTGSGIFDVDRGIGMRIDGTLTGPDDPLITYAVSGESAQAIKSQRPHSLAFKHSHSQLNIEAHWGEYLLQAIDAGFRLLNREYPNRAQPFTPENTLVITSGVSNGGATVLRAIERDEAGWIDGAVVSEPNVMVNNRTQGLNVESAGQITKLIGRTLIDYGTEHAVLHPCALLAEAEISNAVRNAIAPLRSTLEQWCADLHAAGVLRANTLAAQAQEARNQLLEYGILPEALSMGYANVAFSVWTAVGATYASAYAKFAPNQFLCDVSFAATSRDGLPRAYTEEELARAFADSSGIAPTAGVSLVAPDAHGVVRATNLGHAKMAECLRSMRSHPAVIAGLKEAEMTANLRGRPVIILHGRADGLIPVNHASRAYYAVHHRDSGSSSELRYYEVEHGQHFDAFLSMSDFAARFVPLQPHLVHATELMVARLRKAAPLPPSQVIRSKPRIILDGKLTALAADNLGELREKPGADAIHFDGSTLHVPH